MATWKVGDATVKSGGKVTGDGENAAAIRAALSSGSAVFRIEAQPATLEVDPKNDWTLHRYLEQFAALWDLEFETEYEPDDSTAPKAVREKLDLLKSSPRDGARVY